MSVEGLDAEERYLASDRVISDAINWVGGVVERPISLVNAICDAYRESAEFATKVNNLRAQDETLYRVVWIRNEHIAFISNEFGRDIVPAGREVTLTDPGTGRPVDGEVPAVGQFDRMVIVQAAPGS